MVREYKRKTGHQRWNKINMCMAIEAVQNKTLTSSAAAKKFNVPRTTLLRRSKKTDADKNVSANIKLGRFTSTFSQDHENELQKFLLEMDERFYGLTQIEFRRFAFQYAEANNIPHKFNKERGAAGPDWYRGFTQRHNNLCLTSTENISFVKACGSDRANIQKFFDLLTDLMEKYNFPPSRIYNIDEAGITTVQNQAPRVLRLSGKRQVGAAASGINGTTVTTVICYNAAGNFIPPLIIFPRKKRNSELLDGCPPETLLVFHPSGLMQKEVFCTTWLNHFKKHAKPRNNDPVLLILDGQVAHVKNLDFIKSATESNVHVMCLPPHTTHKDIAIDKSQPLDRCFLNPLRTYYSQYCSTWLRSHPGQVITLKSMSVIFGEAYMRAAVPQNAISGFKACGIYPINRHIISEEEFASAVAIHSDVESTGNIKNESSLLLVTHQIGLQSETSKVRQNSPTIMDQVQENNPIPVMLDIVEKEETLLEHSICRDDKYVSQNTTQNASESDLYPEPLISTGYKMNTEPEDLLPIIHW